MGKVPTKTKSQPGNHCAIWTEATMLIKHEAFIDEGQRKVHVQMLVCIVTNHCLLENLAAQGSVPSIISSVERWLHSNYVKKHLNNHDFKATINASKVHREKSTFGPVTFFAVLELADDPSAYIVMLGLMITLQSGYWRPQQSHWPMSMNYGFDEAWSIHDLIASNGWRHQSNPIGMTDDTFICVGVCCWCKHAPFDFLPQWEHHLQVQLTHPSLCC